MDTLLGYEEFMENNSTPERSKREEERVVIIPRRESQEEVKNLNGSTLMKKSAIINSWKLREIISIIFAIVKIFF